MDTDEPALLAQLDALDAQVRHLALDLSVFADDLDEADDEASEADEDGDYADREAGFLASAGPEQIQRARRRRGALLFTAHLLYDQLQYDITHSDTEEEDEDEDESSFVEEHLPSRFAHLYDTAFKQKLLITLAKLAHDLATAGYSYPACTAEELLLSAVLRQHVVILDTVGLGHGWADLREYLLEDEDFLNLYDEALDGIEDDPLAHKTTGILVNPLSEWFTPFNPDRVVHPFVATPANHRPALHDLTRDNGRTTATPDPYAPLTTPPTGFGPISGLVAAERAHHRARNTAGVWVPDETDPTMSFTELAKLVPVSGLLTHETGPGGTIQQVPVLSFVPDQAHPATGDAWASVMYLSGRSEILLSAVVAFAPDPAIRQRWETAFNELTTTTDQHDDRLG